MNNRANYKVAGFDIDGTIMYVHNLVSNEGTRQECADWGIIPVSDLKEDDKRIPITPADTYRCSDRAGYSIEYVVPSVRTLLTQMNNLAGQGCEISLVSNKDLGGQIEFVQELFRLSVEEKINTENIRKITLSDTDSKEQAGPSNPKRIAHPKLGHIDIESVTIKRPSRTEGMDIVGLSLSRSKIGQLTSLATVFNIQDQRDIIFFDNDMELVEGALRSGFDACLIASNISSCTVGADAQRIPRYESLVDALTNIANMKTKVADYHQNKPPREMSALPPANQVGEIKTVSSAKKAGPYITATELAELQEAARIAQFKVASISATSISTSSSTTKKKPGLFEKLFNSSSDEGLPPPLRKNGLTK